MLCDLVYYIVKTVEVFEPYIIITVSPVGCTHKTLFHFCQRGVYFSELSSEQSRSLFKKFVMKWNKGLLSKV